MTYTTKLGWVVSLRTRLDSLIVFPLPNINPNLVSWSSVVIMLLLFIYPQNLIWVFSIVLVSMLLDWFDGLIARRHNRTTLRGHHIDALCDRLSEGVMAVVFFWPWFYLFIINVILSVISWRTEIHFILPLRLIFLLVIFFKFLGFDIGFIN